MKSIALRTLIAVVALIVAAGAYTFVKPDSSKAGEAKTSELAVFTKPAELTASEVKERAEILREASGDPEESSSHKLDQTLLRPVEVDGAEHHVWLAPTTDGGLGVFIPTGDSWASNYGTWGQLSGDGIVALAAGEQSADGRLHGIAVAVALSGAKQPVLHTDDGDRELEYADNVAVSQVESGDSLTSGSATLHMPDPRKLFEAESNK